LTYSAVQTNDAIVDTNARNITLPLDVLEFGNPLATQLGLVYDVDSNMLDFGLAIDLPLAIDPNNSSYSYVLPATAVQHDTTYYYRAYITSYGQTSFGEIKSFVYSAVNSLPNVAADAVAATLYPNPAEKEITIETSIPMQKVEITNAVGQKVYEQALKSSSVKVNTSTFGAGSYIATIYTSQGVVRKTFVVK
jgi:hypothetical protein